MSTGASQIDVEVVREALAILGVGAGRVFLGAPKGTNQVSSFSAAEHIEWDDGSPAFVGSGEITVSTGAGQLTGLITVPEGRVYYCFARLGVRFSGSSGFLLYRWRRTGSGLIIGTPAQVFALSNALNIGLNNAAFGILDTRQDAAPVEIEVQTAGSSAVNQVDSANSGGTMMTVHAI